MIKLLELFGGIGSPRIALRNLGIPVKCYDRVYHKVIRDLEYKPSHRSYKSLEEIVNDSNFVDDMAAFIQLRKKCSQEAMYTLDDIIRHTKMLEDSMIKMKKIFSNSEE